MINTISDFMHSARLKKKYSLAKVEKATKIKKEFVDAIEKGNWEILPEYPILSGFIKNLASFLGVNEKQAVALFRRDYPPKPLTVNPKPDIGGKFTWSPKLTFGVGVVTVIVLVVGYLVFQYFSFIKPPALEIYQPKPDEVVKLRSVAISGKTDPEATVRVNNQPMLISENGQFEGKIDIFEGTNEVVFKAVSRSGKETQVSVKIQPELGTK